jgi:HSP20 family molecular chaperone IbpA
MIPEKSLNPPTSVLPFDMFRTFSPNPETHLTPTASGPVCEIHETENEWVLKINVPTFVDANSIQVELRYGVLILQCNRSMT